MKSNLINYCQGFAAPLLALVIFLIVAPGCQVNKQRVPATAVLIDTDANNELDDQHALAYLFLNGGHFTVPGVTVNATTNGGDIAGHYQEAERVMKLCQVYGKIPLLKGANGSFEQIESHILEPAFDGWEAVDFIIAEANKPRANKLVLLPVGKLTNIALALKKDPAMAQKVRIVWLGSNYPEKGEYNLDNDIPALNYILSLTVPFEMVTVRYGHTSGTGNVYVTRDDIMNHMPGTGPVSEAVEGRHGDSFTTFGDYSVNLFTHCDYYGEPPHRSLFDMAAVAILKNPKWASPKTIPAPRLMEMGWEEQPDNARQITIWEFFDREAILADFYQTLKNGQIVTVQ